jgi:actin, other eukaryote
MSDDEVMPLVFDNGSYMFKAGIAGDDAPKVAFPTMIGRPRPGYLGHSDTAHVGDEAQARRGVLSLTFPIEHGVIQRWDDMLMVWNHALSELRVDSSDHPLLVTDSSRSSRADRERLAQIMFETFDAPALFIANQSLLSLYCSGRVSGVVVTCGDGVSDVVPIVDSRIVRDAVQRVDVSGCDLTEWLMRFVANRGHEFTTLSEREIVRDMKEKLAYVAADFEQEIATTAASASCHHHKRYELPDGQMITLGNERFRCAEALFRPSLFGKTPSIGIHQATHNAISKCDATLQASLYDSVILSGGTTMLPGFADRLMTELVALAPSTMKIKVVAPPERKYSTWVGGSILGSLSTFATMWISKSEYNERGPAIVHQKCHTEDD